jgi:hypothetical protein
MDIARFENEKYWKISSGSKQEEENIRTQGKFSLKISGGGWQVLTSRTMNSEEIACEVSDIVEFDIANFDDNPDPWWIGNVTLSLTCPSANMYNIFIGNVDLKTIGTKTFNTMDCSVPSDAKNVLTGDYDDLFVTFTFNTRENSGPYYIDNLRFSPSWENIGVDNVSEKMSHNFSFAASDNTVYVAYMEYNENYEYVGSVKKLNGTVWETVGSTRFFSGNIGKNALVVISGIPHLVFRDKNNSDKISVMRFFEEKWEYVGKPGLSRGYVYNASIAGDGSHLYILFSDPDIDYALRVMKYSGEQWETVGTPGFSGKFCYDSNIKMCNGIPYIAFSCGEHDYRASVMKWDNRCTKWVNVGEKYISEGEAYTISLEFSGSIAYASFIDYSLSRSPSVKRFTGTSWEYVGGKGVEENNNYYSSLAIDQGIPYCMFSQTSNNYRLTLKRFDSGEWKVVGCPGFSPEYSLYPDLVILDNIPYVAFGDWKNKKLKVMRYK